jgi:hypothetical protein
MDVAVGDSFGGHIDDHINRFEQACRRWAVVQEKLVKEEGWIVDGDLGPYDAVDIRLLAADTIIVLDFSLVRCAWRALRRSRERADFWRWLLTYRRRSRPQLMEAIATHAASADLHVLRNPGALRRFVAHVARAG